MLSVATSAADATVPCAGSGGGVDAAGLGVDCAAFGAS
ncbi:hypothetical protein TR2A62_1710 [Thalassobium sp. R2A62]|nr:hypothetical protein TR2A62_1710 [Thalassobium sp. R2A62]